MGKPIDISDFDLKNTNGNAVLYYTTDATLNLLTFSVINGTGSDLQLTGGTPGVGSTFKIDFSSLLPDQVVEELTFVLPGGWDKLFEPATEYEPPAWLLAPTTDVTLKPDERVQFDISNIVVESFDSGNFEIQWGKIPDQRDSNSALTIWLGVINPPDPKKETLVLNTSYSNVTHTINNAASPKPSEEAIDVADGPPVPVYITYDTKALIFNGYTYFLTNPSDKAIPAKSGVGTGTVLSLSFLVGDLSYDVTTPDRAINRMVIPVTSKDPPWKPDGKVSSAGLITFNFRPGTNVFLGPRQTLSLDVQAIVTALNVDPGTISTMYAQVNNVPEFNDAVFYLALEKKVATAKAVDIKAVPPTIDYGQNVTLSWTTELAKRVKIEYKDRDGNAIVLDSDKGEIPLNSAGFTPLKPPTAATTIFRLFAYDNAPTPSLKECSVTVKQPSPVILTFTSDRSLVDVTGKTDITLSWTTNGNVKVMQLEAPDGLHDVTNQSSYPYKLTASTVFKLLAYGYDPEKPEPFVARTTVFAYKPGATMPMQFTGVAMQNWPVVLASRANNCVFALDAGANLVYKFNASTGAQLATYPGTAMALSPKESKLFVMNGDANKFGVTMVDIASGKISAPVGFGPVAAMVCNESDTLLFCASTNNMTTVTRLAIDAANNSLSLVANIGVGTTPISMVFNDDASMLYVANYKSNNISAIRISDNTVTPINLTASEPNSMVYQKALKRLFVACQGGDTVAMVELSNNAVTYIQTGARPSQVLFNPSQEILFVANYGANTVTIIDTAKGVATSTLTVGEGPIGMALNGDCNLLFVCNYCSRTLSVINLLGNYVLSDVLPTGADSGNAYGLSVYLEGNDYAKVFVGKDNFPDRRSCSAPSPNTSISVASYSIQKP